MKFATLLALTAASTVSAYDGIEIDPFNVKNFMKTDLLPQLIQSSASQAKHILRGDTQLRGGSKVVWAQCDDDKKDFTLDTDSTHAEPDPLVKGQDVQLILLGALSDSINLKQVHIHVTWNGAPLYDEDNKDAKVIGSHSDTYQAQIKWSVPSYAPDGAYVATLTGVDTDGTSKDFCVSAAFSF